MNESESSRPCGSHLDAMEREQISIGLAQGLSARAIGRQLKRPAGVLRAYGVIRNKFTKH